jgi:hypothetical protein
MTDIPNDETEEVSPPVRRRGNTSKARGTAFEVLVADYLKAAGFNNVYRPALAGPYDTGDINGISGVLGQAIIQCKNRKRFDLSGWLDKSVQQAFVKDGENGLPVLVVKRPGKGAAQLGETYAVMRLEDVAALLRAAGYR